jgi:hypothetical protein
MICNGYLAGNQHVNSGLLSLEDETHFGFHAGFFGSLGGCEYELGMGKLVSLAPLRHVFGASYGISPTQTSMSFTYYGSALAEHIDSQMQRFIITSLIN